MTKSSTNSRELLDLFKRMLLIRRSEERLAEAAAGGSLPGGVHLSIGQEATAVGMCAALSDGDWITSTHRAHGHYLARGGEVPQLYAEIWGKKTGICRGMGGSMHIADMSKGILGGNGIVGGGLAICTGAALAAQLDGNGRAAVCFFGDGAANQGVFMESLNVSAIWRLPAVFVCENNGVSEFTISSRVTAGALADRVKAVGTPAVTVDGNDVLAVCQAAREAIHRCRQGEGPSFIEAMTYRISGHAEGEASFLGGRKYRTQEEIESWKAPLRDPISRFQNYLLTQGAIDRVGLDEIETSIRAILDDAIAFAERGEPADETLAFRLTASV